MANLPPSSSAFSKASSSNDPKLSAVEQLVLDICDPELRENALQELSKMREIFDDLAPLLWNSPATATALLQEILSVYHLLSPPTMTVAQSNKVCNALALYQVCKLFQNTANLPVYLYAFLSTSSTSRPFEYLRLTTLGVIGALVKVDDTEVVKFLLETEVVPLCLRVMEIGSELSKTVATFIVHKILVDDKGLDYMCVSAARFFALCQVLGNMVTSPAEGPSPRLLKHIIRCYLRLTDNSRACHALKTSLPELLGDTTFLSCLNDDPAASVWLKQLHHNIKVGGVGVNPPLGLENLLKAKSGL
ncbi:unnamed protein product [Eruca vesicaria subsp. sativa]|uniref:Uncharacterized protein n=1 Tax=Eruca vesicaria subsp. sativa TaxID=29727 RepID=A0ABC8M169_ERUVS|nr:unnamed protein product [Eruca vesicaria subsp. sativa]